jgi:hypothetical protein
MRRRELNCATIEVANSRDISGMMTADEMNRGLRIGRLWRIACLAGLFVVLAPLRGHGDDDREMRLRRADNDKDRREEIGAQTRITSLPYTITTSGTYVLDSSLDYNSSSAVAIQINAPNVTVDLNGNSINNLGAGPATQAVGINAFNEPNVTIRNGQIVGFFRGIELDGQLESLPPRSRSALVEYVRCAFNVDAGIFFTVTYNAVVRYCQIRNTGYSADGTISSNQGIGIYDAQGFGNLIYQNNITQVTGTGIVLGPNDLADGNFVTAATTGIFSADPSSKLKNNTVTMATTPYVGGTQLSGTNF